MGYSLALIANFLGLILSIWLGVYIVTRSHRSLIAWSSGFTLWFLSGVFSSVLLFMLSTPAPVSQPIWLRAIFPIWPQASGTQITGWNLGWATGLGSLFWYQTTALIIPGKMVGWRRWSLYVAYLLGVSILVLELFIPSLFEAESTDLLLVDTQRISSAYPVYAVFLILCSGMAVINLREAKRLSQSIIINKQLNMLINASLIVGLATILSIIGALPHVSIQVFWLSSLLVVAVGFFGFGVIRYSAVLGQRILWRDLAYSAFSISLVVLLYLSIILWLIATYHIPQSIVVILIPLVILSHAMAEEVHHVFERFIYDRRTRVLRSNLRDLSRLAVEQANLSTVLSRSLDTICYPVHATYGVILIFDGEEACPTGTYRWHDNKQPLFRKDFEAEDVKDFDLGSFPEPFLETTLLIPLYVSLEQIGALLLGRPENGIHYSSEDLRLLQESSDHISELVIKNRRMNEYFDQFVQAPLQSSQTDVELIPSAWVEDALKNYCDYSYLGDSLLANIKQVKALLTGMSVTHLDRGKAVCQVITAAVEKLRPGPDIPSEPIPREWYPYLILRDAYFDGVPNRDIILKLYISEGTFHRTRRSAIQSVARVLCELETAID